MTVNPNSSSSCLLTVDSYILLNIIVAVKSRLGVCFLILFMNLNKLNELIAQFI